jgi:hypothetical protein
MNYVSVDRVSWIETWEQGITYRRPSLYLESWSRQASTSPSADRRGSLEASQPSAISFA